MNWMDQIGGMLQQYTGQQNQTEDTERDFEHVSTVAPPEAVSSGLAEAFRSNQTPAFGNMLGQLFGNSDGSQRANVLTTLISAAGPGLLSSLMAGGGLGQLGNLLNSGHPITPEAAQQVPQEELEALAHEAEKRDPTVIDRVSDFYSQHPTLVKSLGAAALGVMMSKMAGQKRGIL